MPPDITRLFLARIVRMFGYGLVSVVLVLFLVRAGMSEAQVGLLLTLALAGDAVVSLTITTRADRFGRRRMLIIGAVLIALTGAVFALTREPALLIAAAIFGVLSPGGSEIGPFLSIEQSALSQLVPDDRRTHTFAWYNLAGSLATAAGALAGGGLAQLLRGAGVDELDAYRAVLVIYAAIGVVLGAVFARLSARVEVEPGAAGAIAAKRFGLGRASQGIVARLSALFALDAFAGGLIVQSIMAYWFYVRFGVDTATLGTIFFGANVLAGISALLAARIARRFGLINTMVFTHLPSNVLLILVPLMPTLELAIGLLLVRFSISQMDVPTRQSYVMAVVAPSERSAAAGITGIARSVGAALSPALTGAMMANPALRSLPFILSGGLKIVYDLALWRSFRRTVPAGEKRNRP